MFFDRPQAGRRAVLLSLRLAEDRGRRARTAACADERRPLDAASAVATPSRSAVDGEFRQLVESAEIRPARLVSGTRTRPHPRWFAGSGKVEELAAALRAENADLLIANHELTAGQQRNLEERLGCRVMTRTELILHIFADRARTREGQLQVELAQLTHARTRLVRGWTHLDRQRGGVSMRGAGEKQIELDARMLRTRIRGVRNRLQAVHGQRERSRRRRQRTGVPTVALVGYTNAGKSTLFNALTRLDGDGALSRGASPSGSTLSRGASPSGSPALVADRLFATLDPLMRRVEIEGAGEVVLADTVGFIRDLPVSLVEAFRATLEQVSQADLLLHVMDATALDVDDLRGQVLDVLDQIGASGVPTVEVLNKIDAGGEEPLPPDADGTRVAVSAIRGDGLQELRRTIGRAVGVGARTLTVLLDPAAGKTRARLYQLGAVLSETSAEDGRLALCVRLDRAEASRLRAEGVELREGEVEGRLGSVE